MLPAHKPRKGHRFALSQRLARQRPDIRFIRKGGIEENRLAAVPNFPLSQDAANALGGVRLCGVGMARSFLPQLAAEVSFSLTAAHEDFPAASVMAARHLSRRSLIFFSTPCSVGS